jgi:hypothetical protein
MSYRPLLPGTVPVRRSFRPGLLLVFLFATLLFLGGGYALLNSPWDTLGPKALEEVPREDRATGGGGPDVAVHLRNNQSQLVSVIENIEKTRSLLQRTAPYLRSAGYNLQARWLESADSYSDAALQAARYSLDETEAAMTHMQERRSQ